MISDEMRELLSAYVDGELRDADAARVEDVSKRDPELRREIEAYRTLRRKLREWDEAAHGIAPLPSFIGSALARAGAMETALSAPLRSGFRAPLALSAALLLAVLAGLLLARSTAPQAPSLPEPVRPIALKPLDPAPDLALEGSALAPAQAAAPSYVSRMRIDDDIPSRRAVELEEAMRQEDLVRAAPPAPEPRTETPLSAEIRGMLDGCTARAAPKDSLVVLARPSALPTVVSVRPVPSDIRGLDSDSTGEGRIIVHSQSTDDMLAPLGEVWLGKSGRTRLVSASEWITPRADNWVRVVWGDGTDLSRVGELLGAQETILGPKARRQLLSAKTGPDAAFLAWLKGAYGTFPAALSADAKDRDRAMNKLVDVLRSQGTATGFAVLDAKGNLLGVEIFNDHAVMLGFAAPLLRGYLLEAGEDGIRVTPPVGTGGLRKVQGFLDAMPGRGLRVDREKLDGEGYERAPKGLCRVNLVGASGAIVGHGLVLDDTPIHLTIFGE